MERRVTLVARALRKSDQQGAAESDSLPAVRDSGGEFNHTSLTGYLDVAHDADAMSCEWVYREQCFVCVVVDIH